MLLNELTVQGSHGVIRTIPFKEGLNLIVDESTTNLSTESGNSVGKTTVLRVIDYCFGSDGKDLYTDSEFNTVNQEVLNFLVNNEINFILTLVGFQKKVVLRRSFSPTNSGLSINGEEFNTLKEYKKGIESKIFKIKNSKPSLRQVMPKFIRKDIRTMSNTLNFLHQTTGQDLYEILFLYLFGFGDQQLLLERFKCSSELRKINRKLKVLKQGRSIAATVQILRIIDRDIDLAEDKINSFEIAEKYKEETKVLNEIKREISSTTSKLNNLKLRQRLSQETLTELRLNKSKLDPQTIQELYEEAQILLPQLQKTFEEVLEFHNNLIDRKIGFVENQGLEIVEEIKSLEVDLDILLNKESHLLKILSNLGSFEELALLQKEVNSLYERRGKESQYITMLQDETNHKEAVEDKIQALTAQLKSHLSAFSEVITEFNLYYSSFSNKLYGEEYFLIHEVIKDKVKFSIDNVNGNVGSGKKKGQISAFDFAFINLQEKTQSNLPRFVMHDSIEDVHKNQIKTLFEMANSLNGQYIVAILKDKLSFLEETYVTDNRIISLSQEEMFFKF